MPKIVKPLAWSVLGAIALILVSGLLILRWPGILLNTGTLPMLSRLGAVAGIGTRWRTGELEVESRSWFRKGVALSFSGLCATRAAAPRVEACFEKFTLRFRIDFRRMIPRLETLGPAELLGGKIQVAASPEEPPRAGEQAGRAPPVREDDGIPIPGILAKARFEPIRIELKELDLPDARGSLDVRVGRSPPMEPEIRFSGEARLGPRETLSAQGHLRSRPISRRAVVFDHDLSAKFRSGGTRIEAGLAGTFSGRKLDTKIGGRATGLIDGALPWITVRDCRLRLSSSRAQVDCPADIPLEFIPRELRKIRLPDQATLHVVADLATQGFPPDFAKAASGTVEIRILSLAAGLVQGGGTIRTRLSGVPDRFPDRWVLDSDLDLAFRVPRFSALVRHLDRTAWAVPAPFRALNGEVRLHAKGKADLISGKFPVRLETRLRSGGSRGQKLDLDAEGSLESEGWADFRATAAAWLTKVRLQLPRLALEVPPRFLPDPRFQRFKRAEAGETPRPQPLEEGAHYRAAVRTPPDSPVELLSNLAKAPVPVSLDLLLTTKDPPSGTIQVGSTPLELFRRKATLERFALALKKPSDESEINGSVRVEYADYRVDIRILGTLARPVLRLSSDPPLPENQLWAALLFGKPLEELDPDQSSSIANTRAAVAEGALSLASLYLLASTPIQSLSYDPATGVLSVKVRLAEGTSLNLGTEAGAFSQLGIRRRLGPHWTLSTDLYRDPRADADGSDVSTFLEWVNRY